MEEIKNYIESGIIEMYVLGVTSPEETLEVEAMATQHAAVKTAIDDFSESVEQDARASAVTPDETIKAFIMATINYSERLQNGEVQEFPPMLSETSVVAEYEKWLNRVDMKLPGDADGVYARIIGYTPEVTTAIVWLKDYAPTEVHHNEYERFLIVEGSCNITVGDEVNELAPGDYIQIPLHKNHKVVITSAIPCKIILQRVAA